MRSFPLSTCWATKLLWPMLRSAPSVEVGDGLVRVRMGWLGGVDIPIANVARLSRMNWPWWGGIGARLGRKMVAYTAAWGPSAVIELVEPIEARAPLRWKAERIVLGVQDVEGFMAEVAAVRGAGST